MFVLDILIHMSLFDLPILMSMEFHKVKLKNCNNDRMLLLNPLILGIIILAYECIKLEYVVILLFHLITGLHGLFQAYGFCPWVWQGLGKEAKVASPFQLGCVQG